MTAESRAIVRNNTEMLCTFSQFLLEVAPYRTRVECHSPEISMDATDQSYLNFPRSVCTNLCVYLILCHFINVYIPVVTTLVKIHRRFITTKSLTKGYFNMSLPLSMTIKTKDIIANP